MKTLIRDATIVNENRTFVSDILLDGAYIEKIAPQIQLPATVACNEIDAKGLYLLPGMIDDQVHFREPGLTHKGTIYSESCAAVAGGITSFMEMPNTIPNTLSLPLLEEKYSLAAQHSVANYSFFMGISQHNLEEALRVDNETICGITDDGLYFDNDHGILVNHPSFLEELFSRSNTLIALHSEDDSIIRANENEYRTRFGNDIPFEFHAKIRSEAACLEATKRVIEIAKKQQARLHLFHISTLAEAELFEAIPVAEKRITAEACVHHLWFSDQDYATLGSRIKWNPSVKTENDKNGLLGALLEGKLDIIATDHAPHTIAEKSGNYFQALSGGPLVQHALPALLELMHQGNISLEKIVEKTSHHVAEIYKLKHRGYIREGYFADLVLVDLDSPWMVAPENILYGCKWSPFENQVFKSKIVKTFVNGHLVYTDGVVNTQRKGQRLRFEKDR